MAILMLSFKENVSIATAVFFLTLYLFSHLTSQEEHIIDSPKNISDPAQYSSLHRSV